MFKKAWEYKKFRFLCVGTFNTLLDFTILDLLVFGVGLPKWAANIISVSVAASMSYFLNHHLVFRHTQRPDLKGYLKFFIITVIGVAAIQTVIIYATQPIYIDLAKHVSAINKLGHRNQITLNLAKLTAIPFGMVWNYAMYSMFVFKKHTRDIPKDPII